MISGRACTSEWMIFRATSTDANDIRFRLSDQLGTVNARLHRHLHGNLKVTRNFGKPLGMPFGSPLLPRRLNLCFLLGQEAPRLL